MSSNATTATAGFRLSLQQERAWTQHERGVRPYAQTIVQVTGELEPARLKRALEEVVAQQEILRTRFRRQAGVKLPFQVIVKDLSFRFEHYRGSDHQLESLAEKERAAYSNLAEDSPLRVLLVTNDPHSHQLILTLPTVCADATTLSNLVGQLAEAYQGHSSGSDVMQYADLVEWQNELLGSEETKAGRDFWRNLCRNLDFGAMDSIVLPLEQKPASGFSPAVVSLPMMSRDAIASQAKSLNTTDHNLFLAAWCGLLLRLTGQQTLTVGCEFDGRRYEELSSALGPLARCLPIPFSATAESSFRALLESVQAITQDSQSWQESFAWNQAAGSEIPALPWAFAYYKTDTYRAGTEVSFSLERLHVVSESFKLRLAIIMGRAGVRLELHYDGSRFSPSSVEAVAGYYQSLMAAAVAEPDRAVSRFPLLSENQRRQLLIDWNDTQAEYPRRQCLHQLFEDQAARTPERIAVCSGTQAYSYRELNERANQLAHYLRAHGVGPDHLVGLCLDRSADLIVAVLATMKAGGAYVPVNPDNPPARIKQQLESATVVIVESSRAGQNAIEGQQDHLQVAIDRHADWKDQPKTNLAGNTDPETLAYVLYTSGSTGVPKGVAVRHRNLVNYTHFITQRLELAKHPAGLHFATVSTLAADLGNTCVYPSLISGGTLHIVPYTVATDARDFAAYQAEHPIDVLKIVPSHLEALLAGEQAAKLLPRKYLIFGGETLTPKLLEKVELLSPSCEIFNHYGPTETTVGV
ncbi:MAG: AMP-binding protein, partial [Acidobacteria bacterium]|nr:AMP-binding protein [Acidobacteriota bacterium]